jgi:hypothetical protein
MFAHRHFDVEIERTIDLDKLKWPDRGEACHDADLGGNRYYIDLRRLSWANARRVFNAEGELITWLASLDDLDDVEATIEDDLDVCIYALWVGHRCRVNRFRTLGGSMRALRKLQRRVIRRPSLRATSSCGVLCAPFDGYNSSDLRGKRRHRHRDIQRHSGRVRRPNIEYDGVRKRTFSSQVRI